VTTLNPSNEYKYYWKLIVKNRAVDALGGKCTCCGNVFPTTVYDFHHINKEDKEIKFGSVSMNGAKSWYKIRDELRKAVLLCPNCHRMVHRGYIMVNNQTYFNDTFYEWDLAENKSVKKDKVIEMAKQIEDKNLKYAISIFKN
jgi:hypothetical protein